MGGPSDDPYMRELGRRALVDLLGEDGAHRALNGLDLDLPDDDLFEEREPEPDPVLADFYSGNSLRALAQARDGLAAAKNATTRPSPKPVEPGGAGPKSRGFSVFPSRPCTAGTGAGRPVDQFAGYAGGGFTPRRIQGNQVKKCSISSLPS